jgi:uncharacterized protein (DUF2147 family)
MKKLYVLAALMMATTAAHAGNSISFEIEGHKIHIEAPRNCGSLSCLKVSAPGLSGSGFGGFKGFNNDDDNVAGNDAPVSNSAPAPVSHAVATPQPAAPAVSNVAAPASAPAVVASTTAAPAARADVATVTPAQTSTAPQPAPAAAASAPLPTGPLGIWATEENKGNVRVEDCGQNLCGYAVKTGEKILINMKPSDSKWTGQIHDPDSGRNYDSTIAMKGTNTMRVQGCAFGGMFCGGQTWKRVS